MKTYALYVNASFVAAKEFFNVPTVSDFGVGAIPTSCYDSVEANVVPVAKVATIPATLHCGASNLAM